MRKYFILSLIISVIPNLCMAENSRITKLMREKQAKMEQLEKCMGTSKGLKIAGISTLGLTAVGVAGNIAEAKVIQDYNDRIETADKNIEKTKQEIDQKKADKKAREEAEAQRIAAEEQAKREGRILSVVAFADIANINNGGYNGSRATSHGYMPEQLPDGLRNQFANAMVGFIERCRSLIGTTNGIKEVSLSPSMQENWRQYVGSVPLAEDTVLADLNEHLIAECKITECVTNTHNFVNDENGARCEAKTTATTPSEGTTPPDGVSPSDNNTPADGATPADGTTPSEGSTPSDGATPSDESTPADEEKPEEEAKPAEGTDCTAEAKQKDSDASAAKYKNGVCKITACATASKKPSNDGKKCVVKIKDGTDCKASLNNPNVTEAKTEGGVCKVKSCSTGFKVNGGANGCVAKSVSEWEDSEKKQKPDEYCNQAYTSDAAKACCLEIHKYNKATSWDGVGMKCNCKKGMWKDNFCTIEETVFKDTKVSSVDDGKKLVAIWAKQKGKTLSFEYSDVNSKGQDYLFYKFDGERYKFEFDSMNETDPFTRNYAIFDIVCSLYDGRPAGSKYKTLAKNGISGSPRSCAGAPEDLKEWCKNIGVSLSGIDKNLGTVLDQNMLGGQTCYKR